MASVSTNPRSQEAPSRPGVYVDRRGVVWKLESDHWDCGGGWFTGSAVSQFGPFVRLVPEGCHAEASKNASAE